MADWFKTRPFAVGLAYPAGVAAEEDECWIADVVGQRPEGGGGEENSSVRGIRKWPTVNS